MILPEEMLNRDPRLSQTIRGPGYTRIGSSLPVAPNLGASVTGYQLTKFVSSPAEDGYNQSTTPLPIFRYAEVLLNYAEAKAETGDLQQSDIDKSRSEEHTSELQSLMRISYAVFCLKKKNTYMCKTTSKT